MSEVSRRLFVTRAAALPALAVPAVAAGAGSSPALAIVPKAPPDDPVIALADEAVRLWHALGAASHAVEPYEEMMWEWRKRNPEPEKAKVKSAYERVKLDPVLSNMLDEQERRVMAALRTVWPSAETDAYDREVAAAEEQHVIAMKKWRRRSATPSGGAAIVRLI